MLTNDYPGVMAMCGPDDFDRLARAYIAAHPSRHPSVRWFGRRFADFAACTPPYDRTPAIAEMARFEWTLGNAFDAPDVAPITADALIALAPEAWETLSFNALPTVRLLPFAYNVPQAWQRREEVLSGDLAVERTSEPTIWGVWRPELTAHFRSLEPDEAAMLEALMAGRPFPELCEILVAHVGEEQAAAAPPACSQLGRDRNDRFVPVLTPEISSKVSHRYCLTRAQSPNAGKQTHKVPA